MTTYEFDRNTKMQYSNPDAEVVIIGITPGNTQLEGNRDKTAKEIKMENSFAGGNMRRNLSDMLDYIGINKLLKISSCKSIFNEDFDKVELTSLLKDAAFEITNGQRKMFNRPEKILKTEILRKEFENGFLKDSQKYSKAKVFVALSKESAILLKEQQNLGKINPNVIIVGIPHPSGANSGRVNAFLGQGNKKLDSSYDWAEQSAQEAKKCINSLFNN